MPEEFLHQGRQALLVWPTEADGFRDAKTHRSAISAFLSVPTAAFQRSARCLALGGAEILVNPTNWGAPDQYLYHVPTRAVENRCWSDRRNQTAAPAGSATGDAGLQSLHTVAHSCEPGQVKVLVPSRSDDEETIAYCGYQCCVNTRDKSVGAANDLFKDRRPELYSVLTAPYGDTPSQRS